MQRRSPEGSRFATVADAVALSGYSAPTIRREIRNGNLSARRRRGIGDWLILWEDLYRWWDEISGETLFSDDA